MAEYLTTKEIARYLRINEKKVYALVAEGKLPAARISGKWLFPKHVIDEWMEKHTRIPGAGLMGAMLDELVVVQGSDDWLFSKVTGRFQERSSVPVVSSRVGSLAGIAAIDQGKAHLAGCHVKNEQVKKSIVGGQGCYLVNLFTREQALIFDGSRHPDVSGLVGVVEQGITFAGRQPLSGTQRLTERLLTEQGLDPAGLTAGGTFSSHLELALAIRTGKAGAGVGTVQAARMAGLDFVPLATEAYKLAIPLSFASHPQMVRLLDFLLSELGAAAGEEPAGYDLASLGKMETV